MNGANAIHSPKQIGQRIAIQVSPTMSGVTLTNTQDSQLEFVDVLHKKAGQTNGCPVTSGSVCTGSIVLRDGVGFPKSGDKFQIWEEAKQFLHDYYKSLPEKLQGVRMTQRMDSVNQSIMTNLSYEHTCQELMYGAQSAWRNSPRCIGRIQWSNLQLFDARSTLTTDDMFNAICNHISYATNGGILRSAITVFDPMVDGYVPLKIWNKQYISYAGYVQSNGEVIGDKSNIEFTKICLKLGWKGSMTRFDILPLVLQKGNNRPNFYPLPDDLVLKVKIRHPRYPKLETMNLEWYALPAVSNMYFDCGGIIYPTCGFNGWYMSTEIVRDITDSGRYNLLKEVASSMGFDVNQPAVFWKDSAAVELNIAIVHSFQEDGVTLVDHHTASDTFMRHMKNENKIRGGCPADWVWISPPIGGSLTDVFHQEMLNYQLKPCYGYQRPLWEQYDFREDGLKTSFSFKNIARSVRLVNTLMARTMAKRVPCTILYASETGTAEQYALRLKNLLNQAFNCKVYSMADYDYTNLMFESLLIAVVSTFGNGESPENGKLFIEMTTLYKDHMVKVGESMANTEHENNRIFAVFGLGSSAYPKFCEFGKDVDTMMQDLGFEQMLPLATGDAMKGQEESFSDWSLKIFYTCCQKYCVKIEDNGFLKSLAQINKHDPSMHKIVTHPDECNVTKALSMIHRKTVLKSKVNFVKVLTQANAKKEYIQVSFDHGGQADYNPGDHLTIFPQNDMNDVNYICQRIEFSEGITPDQPLELKRKQELENGDESWIDLHRLPSCSVKTALTYYLDINTSPTQNFLQQLLFCHCVNSQDDQNIIDDMIANDESFQKFAATKSTFSDFLKMFKSVRPPVTLILMEMPLLMPRFYSVSSTPATSKSNIDLTASVHQYNVETSDGEIITRNGLCSNWMRNLNKDDPVNFYIRRSDGFHMPSDPQTPVILVGPGSGIAPYRGFWQHNLHLKSQGKKVGSLFLFTGCWTEKERVYDDELEAAVAAGVIDSYHCALSRSSSTPKTYVQSLIWKQREKLLQKIREESAYIYVCGDVNMAMDVRKTIANILVNETDSTKIEYSQADFMINLKVLVNSSVMEKLEGHKEDIEKTYTAFQHRNSHAHIKISAPVSSK